MGVDSGLRWRGAVDMEKAPLIIEHVPWCEEAIDALKAAERYDTSGGMATIEQMQLSGAALFRVTKSGEVVMWYALESQGNAIGNEGVVLAAVGGAPGVDLTRQVLPMIENQFVNCRAITIVTKRRGLVKKLSGQGYRCDGYIMRKALNVQAH